MAITLDITGILQAAAYWVSNKGGSHTRRLFFYFYVMLTLISMLLGNDPVILSGTAFLVYYTAAVKLEPLPWLMAEFAAANTSSMVLFVGNPTNVVICEGFLVNNAAFTAYTILPFLACSVSCFCALFVQFRSEKHLPPKILQTTTLDPRRVLRDPIGAWVGSFILGSCLIVIIIVSFFKVDVWKISLPFAGAKLIFDLAWDHYRFSTTKVDPEKTHPNNCPNDPDPADRDGTIELQKEMTLTNGQLHAPGPSQSSSPDMTQNNTKNDGLAAFQRFIKKKWGVFANHFPTLATALPRLPFALIPFAFSQFILIEGLSHQGWIEVFAGWLAKATHGGQMHPTIWLIGVLGVLLCNLAGTNIGATILLTKIVRAVPNFPKDSMRAAAIALAVASNIGAVSFVFSASLAGLLWHNILRQKGIGHIGQWRFAFWNLLPLATMTSFGLAVVSAEMAVLYRR
ncbi:hypothetical protein C0992_012271 [Termitomyces sp. T32_za158]|nr:hypothetical protein C0992_012271 [Termitomyces sp. T32_za158]